MKKYNVIANRVVFAVGKQEHVLAKGDVVELDENNITTRALVERKRIKEVGKEPKPPKPPTPTPTSEKQKKQTTEKPTPTPTPTPVPEPEPEEIPAGN